MAIQISYLKHRSFKSASCDQRQASLEAAISVSSLLMLGRIVTAASLGFHQDLKWTPGFAIALVLYLTLSRCGFARLAACAGCFAIFQIGGVGLRHFMYAAIYLGRSFPMADATLARYDLVLGFDWISYAHFCVLHPVVNKIGRLAYDSFYYQPVVIVLYLIWRNRMQDAAALLVTIPFGIMIVCVFAFALPAYGTVHFYAFADGVGFETADKMAETLDWLRLPALPPPSRLDGALVSFPSFHAVSAVLFLWACRHQRNLLFALLPLNIAMILITPVHGSHYFVDVIAGLMLSAPLVVCVDAMINVMKKDNDPGEGSSRDLMRIPPGWCLPSRRSSTPARGVVQALSLRD